MERVLGYRSRGPGSIPGATGLERGLLRLASTTEELLERNSSGSGLENREYGRGDPPRRTRSITQKLALTSPTSGGRSVGIVHSRTRATEFTNRNPTSSKSQYQMLTAELKKKLNSLALDRERTIPTERPLLVGEVSADICRLTADNMIKVK
jgi:hypothetical protein